MTWKHTKQQFKKVYNYRLKKMNDYHFWLTPTLTLPLSNPNPKYRHNTNPKPNPNRNTFLYNFFFDNA